MATTSLIFKALGKIDSLVVDAVVNEGHQSEVEVTEHPVEEGANVADHARVKPVSLKLSGMVSDTPLSAAQNRRAVDALGSTFQSNTSVDTPAGKPGYADAARARLEALRDARTLISVVTSLKTYENLILTKIEFTRDAKTGDALVFSAEFREIIQVRTKTSSVTVSKEPKASGKKKLGKKVAKPTDDATTEDSWLYGATKKADDQFGGVFGALGLGKDGNFSH